jgi:hypothetical protein
MPIGGRNRNHEDAAVLSGLVAREIAPDKELLLSSGRITTSFTLDKHHNLPFLRSTCCRDVLMEST